MTDTLLEHLKKIAPLGGKASAAKLSKAQRKQRAKHASQQRKVIIRKNKGDRQERDK